MCCSTSITTESKTSDVKDIVLTGVKRTCTPSLPQQSVERLNEAETSKTTKSVSFGTIQIREHRRIVGDQTIVTGGPALSLGWYDETDGCDKKNESLHEGNAELLCRSIELSIDEYERTRVPRKSKLQQLSHKQREKLLMEFGYTPHDIYRAMKEINKQFSVIRVISDTVRKLKRSRSTDLELYDLMKQASFARQNLKSSDEFSMPSLEKHCKITSYERDRMKDSLNFAKDSTDDTESYLSEASR